MYLHLVYNTLINSKIYLYANEHSFHEQAMNELLCILSLLLVHTSHVHFNFNIL